MVSVPAAGKGAVGSILVVEDDPTVSDVLTRYLERDGYTVEAVGDGEAALAAARRHLPDLVILDIMLPRLDGFEVCRQLRARAPVPIIMLTARGEESDRIMGLDLGADDYVSKPFSPRELVARVRSVLRRAGSTSLAHVSDEPLGSDGLEVRPRSHEAYRDGELLTLTAREFDLLVFMMSNPGTVFTREDLLERVWGFAYGDTSTVTVHVWRLREKVEADPARPRWIKTVWGVGYRFDP